MRFTFGADPEIFVFDKTSGVPVSAHGMVPGDKENPFPVNKGAVQVDGMALEFNIDPVTTEREFTSSVFDVLKQMEEMLPDGVGTGVMPSVEFTEEYMAQQPEVAKRLGCEPDFDAYTGNMNPAPDNAVNFRTAAGHIHIGWGEGNFDVQSKEHLSSCRMLVKALDAVVGTRSVMMDPDKTRRKLYGKAGAFRPKPYGCEYRVLSNFWLRDKETTSEIFELVKKTCEKVEVINGYPCYFNDARMAINSSDYYWAREMSQIYSRYV